jgi:hypothetical protein
MSWWSAEQFGYFDDEFEADELDDDPDEPAGDMFEDLETLPDEKVEEEPPTE